MNSDGTTEHARLAEQCPEPRRLAALLAPASLPDAEAAALAAHLEDCDACRRRLDALAGGADLLDGLAVGEAPDVGGATAPNGAVS